MRAIGGHVVAAFGVVVLDGVVAGQGGLGLLAGGVALTVLVPLWASALGGDDAELASHRGRAAAVWGVAAVLVIALARANASVGERNARKIADACEKHKLRSGAYPERLADLVPAELPEIPRARRSILRSEFEYFASPGDHRLLWTVMPPHGRRVYTLETGRLQTLD